VQSAFIYPADWIPRTKSIQAHSFNRSNRQRGPFKRRPQSRACARAINDTSETIASIILNYRI